MRDHTASCSTGSSFTGNETCFGAWNSASLVINLFWCPLSLALIALRRRPQRHNYRGDHCARQTRAASGEVREWEECENGRELGREKENEMSRGQTAVLLTKCLIRSALRDRLHEHRSDVWWQSPWRHLAGTTAFWGTHLGPVVWEWGSVFVPCLISVQVSPATRKNQTTICKVRPMTASAMIILFPDLYI